MPLALPSIYPVEKPSPWKKCSSDSNHAKTTTSFSNCRNSWFTSDIWNQSATLLQPQRFTDSKHPIFFATAIIYSRRNWLPKSIWTGCNHWQWPMHKNVYALESSGLVKVWISCEFYNIRTRQFPDLHIPQSPRLFTYLLCLCYRTFMRSPLCVTFPRRCDSLTCPRFRKHC